MCAGIAELSVTNKRPGCRMQLPLRQCQIHICHSICIFLFLLRFSKGISPGVLSLQASNTKTHVYRVEDGYVDRRREVGAVSSGIPFYANHEPPDLRLRQFPSTEREDEVVFVCNPLHPAQVLVRRKDGRKKRSAF